VKRYFQSVLSVLKADINLMTELKMMIEMLLVGGITGIVAALLVSIFALSTQKRALQQAQEIQRAWEHAQEARHQQWQTLQEQNMLALEQKLIKQIKELQYEWQIWEAKDAERTETLKRQYELATTEAHISYELARLPHVEDTPLTLDHQQRTTSNWQPPRLQGADLSHRNLSSRYLGYADLRDAQLVDVIFYMADLFRAWLAGANLTGADLSAANLTEADLRGAILTGANFQVADLNNTVLIGADLRGARNLSKEQILNTIYDDTTRFDDALASHLLHASNLQRRLG